MLNTLRSLFKGLISDFSRVKLLFAEPRIINPQLNWLEDLYGWISEALISDVFDFWVEYTD
jgi:hypothetical protein